MGKQIFNMTKEELAEAGRKGGKASGEAKRRKKQIRQTLECFLNMPMKSGTHANIEDIENFAALKGKNINVQEAIGIAMIQNAMKGDVKAAEYVRDTIGQKPTDKSKMELDMPVMFMGEDNLED